MKRALLLACLAWAVTTSAQVPSYVPTDGLMVWYPFSGNALDASGNGNHGINNGGVPTTDRFGQTDGAYYFSSSNCATRVDAQIDMQPVSGTLSLSFWLSRSGNGCISPRILEMLGTNGSYIQASVGNSSTTVGFDGGISSTTPIQDNEWSHFVLTIESNGYATLYQNGAAVDSGTMTPSGVTINVNNLTGDLALGRMNHSAWDAFNGKLDDVGMWSRALTESEVLTLFTEVPPISGCMEEDACNYDNTVTIDDGSCIPSGCMDEGACNYNADAQCEGEACDYSCCPGPGCCGDGMHWDADEQTCVITPPSVAPDAECTILNLQELAAGYQILLAQNAELDSLLADCNGTSTSAQSGPCFGEDVVTYHGYDYDIIEIGDQCWFAENLRTSSFQDGSAIPFIGPADDWYVSSPGFCHWQNSPSHAEVHGNLYNWFTATDSRGLCPSAWHVPSDDEWASMEAFVGMPVIELQQTGWRGTSEGASLKSTSEGGTNDYGFNGLISGYRCATSGFCSADHSGFWTSSEKDSQDGWARWLGQDENRIMRYQDDWKHNGNSVRCVKD